ncbi:MAG: response regulator [Deltaproteobacteria bacterium]|nr:response regulator [Deltaproteobacteria bacterium]
MDKFSLLVVDDEVEFVDTIIKRLRARGLDVQGVESGKEALELMRTKSFDLCVLDIKMPGMDGIETLQEMKRIDPSMEVITLTGHGSEELALRSIETGASAHILKPVTLDELLERMREVYEKSLRNRP